MEENWIHSTLSWLLSISGETWFGVVIGVVVSVITLVIGLRRTVGAREQRRRTANDEIISSLVRFFASQRRAVQIDEILRLRALKARKYGLSEKLLLPPKELVGDVYAHIFENEYIKTEDRDAVLGEIQNTLSVLSKEVVEERALRPLDILKEVLERFLGPSFALGAAAAVASALAAWLSSQ
jgi:hypothetical protein